MYLSNSIITHLKNGNVIFNNEELSFKELPKPIILELFKIESKNKKGEHGALNNDDLTALELFFKYAEAHGCPFPTIPTEELLLQHEQETTFYKYSEPTRKLLPIKQKISTNDESLLLGFINLAKHYKIFTDKELKKIESKCREKIENETTLFVVEEAEPIRDENGNKLIDWQQQTKQNKNNALIREFWKWMSKNGI